MNADYFQRRMLNGRLRQLAISASSICVAGLFIALFNPNKVGHFAYYAIVFLLVVNSVLALLQFQLVIRPIEELLSRLCDIAGRVKANDLEHIERISTSDSDAFSCLAAGMDGVVEAAVERITKSQTAADGLEDMLTALPISLVVLTLDGKVAKIFNANGLGEAMQGFRVGEKPVESYWGAENVQALDSGLQASRAKTEATWCDLTVARHEKFGSLRFRIAVNRLNSMSSLMTLVNMTHSQFSRQEDAKAAQAANAHSRNRSALRRMAASIAHDGKNVLAALGNLVSLNRDSSDPSVREQVPVAEDILRRGTALMQELAGFAGETRLNLQCVSAAKSLRAIIDSPSVQALLPSNIQLKVVPSSKPLPEIDLDADQAWKVAMNLVKNAVEALQGNNGRLTVKSEPCTMTEDLSRTFRHSGPLRMSEGVLISFSDDGPGMQEEIVSRLFEPYYSSKGEGRGLGLATVMTIVDAHSGAIRVKSSPGQGTTFSIFLPASRNTAQEVKMMQEIAPNGELLLVDDDPTILHTTGLVLRALKMAAHPATNEEDAMAKLRSLRTRVRAVLVDGSLGGLSSTALVRRIHGEFPDIPVVIVSGSPRETIERQFEGVPFDRFISKPYAISELSKVLDEVTHKA